MIFFEKFAFHVGPRLVANRGDTLLALALLCFAPGAARAELYAYNGFDYASGGSIGIPLNHGDTLVGLDPSIRSLGSINMAGTSAGGGAGGPSTSSSHPA